MAGRTKNKSVSLRPKKQGSRLMPSFGEADIITPTEGDVGDIVSLKLFGNKITISIFVFF